MDHSATKHHYDLIEVIKNEADLSQNAGNPAIQKKYFKEVFDKHNKVLRCEMELTSDDNAGRTSDED